MSNVPAIVPDGAEPKLQIYGASKLKVNEQAQVIVLCSTKEADKAQDLLTQAGIKTSQLATVSWAGGATAVKAVDWSPLYDRSIGLWPSPGEAGTSAMLEIGRLLKGHVDDSKLKVFRGVPDELPDGFDLRSHIKAEHNKTLFSWFESHVDGSEGKPQQPDPNIEEDAAAALEQSVDEGDAPEADAGDQVQERSAPADAEENPIEGYFRVLGFDRKTMYIYSIEKRQVLEYSARDLTESGLLELAPANWWEESFPGSGGAINRKAAANAIIRLANERGIYNQGLVRGRGAWWDSDRLVVHLGDRLLVDGIESGLAEIPASRYVYEQDSPLADIASQALTDGEGQRINEIARMFRWERSVSADMLAGWLFLAPICGALKWRPHIWITGGAGAGKTTLLEHFVRRLLPESMPVFANGDSSEAGLRQKLASEARPLLVDETEADSDRAKSRIEAVLGLLRQSSSDTTSRTYRGTVGGKSQSFSLRTMACMASIGVALQQQQDFERIEVLALRPKRSDRPETSWETIKEHLRWIAKDQSIGSRMLKRAISMANVIAATVDVFAAAAAVTLGTQRNGDQIGTLLAGAWCLQKSRAPSFEEAEAVLQAISWDEFRASHQEEGVDLVATLLGCPVILEGGVRTTIGLLIERATGRDAEGLESMEPKRANASLGLYGLKVVADDLKVHTKNAELGRLLSGTGFRNGLHERMRRIEGADTLSGKPFRIGGVSTNGLVIPLASILPKDAEEGAVALSPRFDSRVPEGHPLD
ncbi:MAG TPA: hypothetical protein VLC92_09595 [Rhodocyclaceae bacterium]|nr:hypothetical protein [Rhodocyclaceae bacterium]